MESNKELLRKQAEELLTLSGKISTFINEQSMFNNRIDMLLSGDPSTETKGVVQNVRDIEHRLESLENLLKFTKGKSAGFILAITIFGGIVWKIISFFK